MNHRLAVLALLALVPSAARAAEPVSFCGVTAPPLVYATSSSFAPGFSPTVFTRTLYVLQGGFTVITSSRHLPGENLPVSTQVTAGQGDPAAYGALVAAMAAVRVGFQRDCYTLPLDAHFAEDQTRLTWFGRGRRQNTFLVTNLRTELPPCPAAMDSLIDALEQYVLALKDRHTLATPPVPLL